MSSDVLPVAFCLGGKIVLFPPKNPRNARLEVVTELRDGIRTLFFVQGQFFDQKEFKRNLAGNILSHFYAQFIGGNVTSFFVYHIGMTSPFSWMPMRRVLLQKI